MKAFLSLTALMLSLGFTTVQAATTVFMIGIDHEPNATSEFEQEGNPRTDQKYYWENGDYSSVIGRTGAGQATGQPASSHDIDYYLNGIKIGDVSGLMATHLPRLFSLAFDASQFEAGASVLSWTRTGGVPGYVNMDFVRLSVVPEPSLSVLTAGGLAILALRRRRLAQ